ncbi:MAG: alpha-amylase [Dysgonamonadaceae bacterium]|jgi:glycosidase|nr:alpha-amylase [Dysgonamonadaceae bacterium]
MKDKQKIIIYQVLPRLFGNDKSNNIPWGGIEENGCGKMSAFTRRALKEIRKLGCTHVWFTGLIEHATRTDYSIYNIRRDFPEIVKGRAGSPYAIKDYYDVCPDLADNVPHRRREFKKLIDRTHASGLKAIIDLVPNHVARQYHSDAKPRGQRDFGENDKTSLAFDAQNNFYYLPGEVFHPDFLDENQIKNYAEFPAKVTGNDCFSAHPGRNDWYETVKLNYGIDYRGGARRCFKPIPDTWLKMRDIVCYWASQEVDGFRCDMAEMVPVEFWEWLIADVKKQYPNLIFIAEVYNPALYRDYIERGGFDYLYDKVGLYDTLKTVIQGGSARAITGCWQSLGNIRPKMLNFLENHDEQRIASDFFAYDAWKALPALAVSAAMYSNPFLIYAGQEFGERGMDAEGFSGRDGRTTIFDYWNPDTLRRWYNEGRFDGDKLSEDESRLCRCYSQILNLCGLEKSITKGDFFDLLYANTDNPMFNPDRQYAFLRFYEDELMLVAVNFAEYDLDADVSIPPAAFNYFGIRRSKPESAVDALTGEAMNPELSPSTAYRVRLARYGYRFVKFHYKKIDKKRGKS